MGTLMAVRPGVLFRSFPGIAGKIQRRLVIGFAIVIGTSVFAILIDRLVQPEKGATTEFFFIIFIAALLAALGGYWMSNRLLEDTFASIEKLENSQKESSESDRFQLEFLEKLAHDLRSPVATMMAHAELISDPAFREDQVYLSQCAEVVNRQGRQVVQFLEDVQSLVSVEQRRIELFRAPYHISQMVEQLATEIGEMRERQVHFENRAGDPVVVGDAMLLREALIHLIDNGLKYSPPGTPVEVTLQNSASPGWIEISVKDTGIGIDESEKQFLFRAFGRVKNSNTTGIPGSGLGLYTVVKIIHYSKGNIQVESQPGQGSTFTISLPLQ